MQISTIGEKAKAHCKDVQDQTLVKTYYSYCKDVQDQTLVKNILQLVVKKGKKGPKHFFKTIGRSLHQAPPRSTLVQNGHKHANFHYKGKAKAHCKDVQAQTLVKNILQLVVKKGKKVQNIFSKQSVVYTPCTIL